MAEGTGTRTERPVGEVRERPLGPAQVRVGHLDGGEGVDGGLRLDAVALVDLLLAVGAWGRGAGGGGLGPGARRGVEGPVVDLLAEEKEGADLGLFAVGYGQRDGDIIGLEETSQSRGTSSIVMRRKIGLSGHGLAGKASAGRPSTLRFGSSVHGSCCLPPLPPPRPPLPPPRDMVVWPSADTM